MSGRSFLDVAAGIEVSAESDRRARYRDEPLSVATLRALAAEDTSWKRYAACRGLGPDLFFSEGRNDRTYEGAKAICATCDVCFECADYGARFGDEFGVWGGLVGKEVRRWRRLRQRRIKRHSEHLQPCDCATCRKSA